MSRASSREPGAALRADDVAAHGALDLSIDALRHGVVSRGVLLVRTGRWACVAERGDWNPRERLAGLHAACLPWLRERGVAALGCDGVSDVHPSGIDDVRLPIHIVGIVAMGASPVNPIALF